MPNLVLKRNNEQGVTMTLPSGERIHVTVDICSSKQVALVIDAPRTITVNRDEIQNRIDGVEAEPTPKPTTPVIKTKKARSYLRRSN